MSGYSHNWCTRKKCSRNENLLLFEIRLKNGRDKVCPLRHLECLNAVTGKFQWPTAKYNNFTKIKISMRVNLGMLRSKFRFSGTHYIINGNDQV